MTLTISQACRLVALWVCLAPVWNAPASAAARSEWYPVAVDVWEPPFNTDRQRVTRSYNPVDKASKRWRFCVLIPHLKDAFWLAVNYGLVDQARQAGIDLTIYEAGGYERLDVQRGQFDQCLQQRDKPYDGIIVSAIAADGIDDQVAAATQQGIPVLDLINGIDSPDITARSAVDYYDAGFQAGEYLKSLHAGAPEPISVAWFPGPDGAGWVAAGDAGFRAALADSPISIVATRRGDTGKTTQARLIEAVLDEIQDEPIDYIVGTTVTAEAAVSVLRSRDLTASTRVVAYYFGPGVNRGIRRGTMLAAPSDAPVIQARIAIDTLVRILDEQPYFRHVAPKLELLDQGTIGDWDASTALAPRGFRPIFSVGD